MSETKARKQRPCFVIMRRECAAYFSSPAAYIVEILFLVLSGIFFFSTFFIAGRAELRSFFSMLPLLMSLFIPAITMRLFSEEKRSGTIETLMTLPVRTTDVIAGKYLAALISSLALLVPTLSYVAACCIFGDPDAGPILGGYAGSVLLCAAYCAIGIFSSAATSTQIIAFFLSFAICAILSLLNSLAVFMPDFLVSVITFVSSASHFESISRGIIDTRDVIYFVSVAAVFLVFTNRTLEKSKRG